MASTKGSIWPLRRGSTEHQRIHTPMAQRHFFEANFKLSMGISFGLPSVGHLERKKQ